MMPPVRHTPPAPSQTLVVPSLPSNGDKIVKVKWESRVVGFNNTHCVELLVQKTCSHFRLDFTSYHYVLVGCVEDEELELSDDMLARLPSRATVSLVRFGTDSTAVEAKGETVPGETVPAKVESEETGAAEIVLPLSPASQPVSPVSPSRRKSSGTAKDAPKSQGETTWGPPSRLRQIREAHQSSQLPPKC